MRRRVSPSSRRRGLSLAVVVVMLSTCVVLAIALLHSQASALRVAENGRAAELAAQAAQTGVAAALDAIQNPAWGGVGTTLTAEVGQDALGYSHYRVTFERVAGDGTEAGATSAALRVRIRSKGRWQAYGSARSIDRDVLAVVALTPRLPGRPARPGDVATASDRAADAAGFAAASPYVLLAASGSDSFFARPQTRVAGNVWIDERIAVFHGLSCTSTQLGDLLTGLGTDSGGTSPFPSPHPLAGGVVHRRALEPAAVDALTRLNVSRTVSSSGLGLPAFDPTRYRRYRLYAGGFEYNAASTGGTLQNVSLGPTDANPLGIFYCNGSLTVRDNVVIRGTLVATNGIAFEGRGITITPVDWRDGAGGTFVTDRDLWPILPAVVAGGHVTVSAGSRLFVEGTVLTSGDFIPNTPDYAEENAALNFDGTATARPLGGGLSEVRVSNPALLAGLTVTTQHAVRLNGPAGRWHPVVSGDVLTGVFRVRGTAEFPSAVACRFRPRRLYHADLAGPLIAGRVLFGAPPAWANLSSSTWTAKHDGWKAECGTNALLGLPSRTFSAYLNDPLNWALAGSPYGTYGLPLEPTVRVDRPNVNYACEPPLFRPDPSARSSGGGYRWEVLSWREVTP